MSNRLGLLIYTAEFLHKSMTFVYNQLKQAEKNFHVFAGCTRRLNEKLFPFDRIIVFPERRDIFYYVQAVFRQSGLWYTYRNKKNREALVEFIRTNRISIVHAHFGPFGIRVFESIEECSIPLLITFHGSDASQYLRNPGYVRILKKIMESPLVHGVTVSRYMIKALEDRGIDVSKTICHYIGTDTGFFSRDSVSSGRNDNNFVFLQVSSFEEKKGHEFTVRAFSNFIGSIKTNEKEPLLILAGEGSLKRSIENLVKKLGIERYVRFPGFCDKHGVRRLMADANVFVHHSITTSKGNQEGIPTVMMEAMAMELPVISTRHAGIPELVTDGVHGYLVEEKDIDAYSGRMRELFTADSVDYTQNRIFVSEHFDLEKNSKVLCDYYRKIIENYQR